MDIHAGPLVIGRIGYGDMVDLIVVGNAVNVASRLEALAKGKRFQIVVSSDVARDAGCLGDVGPLISWNVRGVDEPLQMIDLARGRDLPLSILRVVGNQRLPRVRRAAPPACICIYPCVNGI
jgi:adenylate cyclase